MSAQWRWGQWARGGPGGLPAHLLQCQWPRTWRGGPAGPRASRCQAPRLSEEPWARDSKALLSRPRRRKGALPPRCLRCKESSPPCLVRKVQAAQMGRNLPGGRHRASRPGPSPAPFCPCEASPWREPLRGFCWAPPQPPPRRGVRGMGRARGACEGAHAVQADMWRQVLDGGEGTWWSEGGGWAGRWEVAPQNKPRVMGTNRVHPGDSQRPGG